jgi:PAS domain S-box-containing protein
MSETRDPRHERLFREAIENVRDYAIFTMDRTGEITSWNTGAERLFGYAPDEILGRHGSVIFTPEDVASRAPERELSTAATAGRAEDERWHLRKDGSRFWASGVVTAVRDDAGTLLGFVKVARDETERKRAEDALRRSEERLALAQEAGNIGTFDWDITAGAITWNEQMERICGFPPGGFQGTFAHWRERVHDADVEACEASLCDALDRKLDSWRAEYRILRADTDDVRWLDARSRIVYEGGVPVRMIGLAVDVTDRKSVEEALWERARSSALAAEIETALSRRALGDALRYCVNAIVNHLDAAFARIWLLDEPTATLELVASAGMYTHLDGKHSRIPLGHLKIGRIASDRCPYLTNRLADDPWVNDPEWARREGMVAFAGYPLVAGDRLFGVVAMFARHMLPESTILVLSSAASRVAAGIERRRVEAEREELLAREHAARTLAERRWAESVRLAEVNHALARSLEMKDVAAMICAAARDLTGADGATFVVPEGVNVRYAAEDAIAPLWKGQVFPADQCLAGIAMRSRAPIVVEDIYADARLPHEAYRPTFVKSAAVLPIHASAPVATVGVYWAQPHRASDRELGLMQALADVADLALANARLYEETKAARDEAESANRLKDEFLATISHELRTPLNSILGWTRMLRAGDLDSEKEVRALEIVERNAKAQARLIEDMLDVSRIISGKVRLDMEAVEPLAAVEAAVDSLLPSAQARGVHLSTALDPSAGPITGDAARLQQVVWNLLANAIKFTPRGGRVEVRLERAESGVVIAVSDTGEGIEPEFLPYVFDRFRQGDATTTRRHGGLGLGLAIVRHLVDLHGGTIHAESEGAGRGARFVVDLPARALPAQAAVEHVADRDEVEPAGDGGRALAGVRVLVVDDERDTRELVGVALGANGAEVLAAASADEALREIGDFRPNVIVSDIGMPNVDGYDLVRALRALPASEGGRTPAIALTAYAGENDRTLALEAGFDAHVVKPIDPEALASAVARLVGDSRG